MLNKICFTVCIVCIIAGTVLSLAMIWAEVDDDEFMWKAWMTILVFFIASALTMVVNGAMARTQSRN